MKKIAVFLMAALLMISFASCGGSKKPSNDNGTGVTEVNGEVTSDVELLDFAEERICYLFAPEGFEFNENSAEDGYNGGRNHILETPDEDYEINAGLIAGYDSTLYDLFLNGELTGTFYSGMEIDPEDVYELTVKEELGFEVAGNKVYYIERTINGEYLTGYVVFEHIGKDGLAGLYGVDLYSNNSDFYTKENSIKVFKEVFGIGRTESAVYFETTGEEIDTYGTLESAELVYGSDNLTVTIYRPENATLELEAEDLEDDLNLIWITENDYAWTVDVFGAVSYDLDVAGKAVADYYYKGELHPNEDDYAYFDAYDYELDIEYKGQPVKVIEYTYVDSMYADEDYDYYEETEYFVGVEFEDTFEGEHYGNGLLGYRYYMYDETPSDDELAKLFCEIFGVEGYEFDIEEEEEDIWAEDEGFDTDLIVGEWKAVDSDYEEIFFFYASDYATYSIDGEELELEYTISDDGFLYIVFEDGSNVAYSVTFDGSDTMILEDDFGDEMVFERI